MKNINIYVIPCNGSWGVRVSNEPSNRYTANALSKAIDKGLSLACSLNGELIVLDHNDATR
ncbi:MAG: hypothetical protein RR250_03880 [Akkermansia sp.]